MRIKFKSAFASLSTRHGCLSSARMTHASAEYCELCIHPVQISVASRKYLRDLARPHVLAVDANVL